MIEHRFKFHKSKYRPSGGSNSLFLSPQNFKKAQDGSNHAFFYPLFYIKEGGKEYKYYLGLDYSLSTNPSTYEPIKPLKYGNE